MKCTLITWDNNGLVKQEVDTSQLADLLGRGDEAWINFNTDDREALLGPIRTSKMLSNNVGEAILKPGDNIRLRMSGDQWIIDLHVFGSADAEEPHFVTMLFLKNKIITIAPSNSDYLDNAMREWQGMIDASGTNIRSLCFGYFNYIMEVDSRMAQALNTRTANYSKLAMVKNITGNPDEVVRLKQRTLMLQEVLENQFAAFGLLPLQFVENPDNGQGRIQRLVKAIEHLQRIAERIEDKLDDIHDKYLYDLQDQTNRRINLLTVMQSIFVPITFIAGVYGMNFNIPELSWSNGYFYAIGLMASITLVQLIIFYFRGWFR